VHDKEFIKQTFNKKIIKINNKYKIHMLPSKDIKQISNLYQHILTERKMYGQDVNESFLTQLANADPDTILDPNTAGERNDAFMKSVQARKAKSTKDIDVFGAIGKSRNSSVGSRPAEIPNSDTGKQLTTINGKQLKHELELAYLTNLRTGTAALMIYGASGIGKSDIIRQMAKKFAAHEQREFVYWSDISTGESVSEELKQKIFNNPKHYYICSVMNSQQLAPERVSGGIPDMFKDEPRVTERPFEEMAIWMTPGISGMLFLDELNHADAERLNSLFSVVLEKRAGSRSLVGNRMLIVGAGNLGGGHAVNDLPTALVNRVASFWLVIDPEDWFEWAGKADIHPSIIAFVKADPQHNFRAEHDVSNSTDKNVGFPCPRNFKMLNDKLPDIFEGLENGHFEELAYEHNMQHRSDHVDAFDMLTRQLFRTASGTLGEVWSGYWVSFLKYYNKYGNLNNLLNLDSQQLASYYASSKGDDKKDFDYREVLNVIAGITHYLHSELVKAIDELGMFDKSGSMKREYQDLTYNALSPEEQKKTKEKTDDALTKRLNGPHGEHLKKVLQALSKVVYAVKNTTQVGNNELNVAEMVPMVTQRVPAGLSEFQRQMLGVATQMFGRSDPLIADLHKEIAVYITDNELRRAKVKK